MITPRIGYICAGEELKKILNVLTPEQDFIPFNEAMIEGEIVEPLFSDAFISKRAKTHHVSVEYYRQTMKSFLNLLEELSNYDKLMLYFGKEPFCQKNVEVLLATLKERNYRGSIELCIVDEHDGTVLKKINIQ